METNTIDFTRGDLGLWFGFVIFLLLYLATAAKLAENITLRWICRHLPIGGLLASAVILFLAVWQRWPLQYFIDVRLETNQVVLGFRWPEPELAIPYGEITAVHIVKTGSFRRPASRVQLETSRMIYRSFGFNRLDDDEVAVLNRLREMVGR